MNVAWPLVGRASELEAVAGQIRSGNRGIVIAGPAGVGKTRLATECLSLAASLGLAPLKVSATAGASSLPFGAFAHLLPDLAGPSDQKNLLRRLAAAVRDRGNGRPVAVMVDDAHLLDDPSAALTHQLIEGEDGFVLTTLRSGERTPQPILSLWKDGLVERLELRPLSNSELEELLQAVLGGPIDGVAVDIFQERARGNALFLKELVLGALDSGLLAEQEGVWRLSGSLQPPDRLVEIVETRLAALSDADRRAAELLACVEPIGQELFKQMQPDVDLERLERHQLLRAEVDGRRTSLRLDHPLYAEVLRAKLPVVALQRIARSFATVLERTGARRRSDPLVIATKRLEGGGPFDPQLMLVATRMARARNDMALAERLARAATSAGMGFEAQLLVGQLCWHQGRAEEAERLLRDLVTKVTSDEQRAVLANTHAEVMHVGLGDSEGALEIVEHAEAQISDPSVRDQLVVGRARILGRSGRNAEAAALVEPLLDRTGGLTLVHACFAAATSMPITGQFQLAMKATEVGFAEHSRLSGAPPGFSPQIHKGLRCYALFEAGYWTEAWDLATAEYEKAVSARSLDSQGFLALPLAFIPLAQGRPATAERFAGEAVGVFRQIGWGFMERMSLIGLVLARALQGKAGEAEVTLKELDALGIPETDLWGPRLLQARAWVQAAGGNLPGARELLWQADEMARAGGAFVLSCSALHDLARLGKAAEVAGPLVEQQRRVEGPLAPVQASYAAALASGDPAGLEEVSQSWEELGALVIAAEAAIESAAAWSQRGDRRRATRAGRRSVELQRMCEGVVTPTLSTVVHAQAALTPRELEVARLAAAGLSDKRIAERLFLSPRTVGNLLYSAYQKLGVKGRDELAAALFTQDPLKK